MKTIILTLGIAAMAHFSATAQTTNTGSTMPPSTSTQNGGKPNNNVPGGYKAPSTTKTNTNYQSHYKQGTKTPANSTNTNTNTPMSPTVTTPNPVATPPNQVK